MKTTRDYQNAIALLAKDAGWVSIVQMNTPEGVKIPLMNKSLGAFIVPVDDGDDYWSVHGSENDVSAWNDMASSLSNTPLIREFIEHVEEYEDYSIAGDTISTIILDAWWWSQWSDEIFGSGL